MEWLEKLGAAIDYIEDNLDKEISYDEAARIACCSTYYFQRIFSYLSGVSLSEYIRRRKMTQAAFELQRTDSKVIDVAYKYGYSSPTSFNRAFQSVHGIAPIAAKNMGCTLCAYPSIQFSIKVSGGSAMSYHIERKKMFVLWVLERLLLRMQKKICGMFLFFGSKLYRKIIFQRFPLYQTEIQREY